VLFVFLGLTDAVDGALARRYGSTPLGALLDPIVDKIFLVAAFGPLADLRMVSPPMVTIVFVRELAITMLRSVALEEGVNFKTSKIAKLKTSVQFAGGGFIFLYWTLRSAGVSSDLVQIAALVGAAAAPIVRFARGKRPQWRAWSGFVLISIAAVLPWLFDVDRTVWVLMAMIVTITLVSGLEYLFRMRGTLAARFRRVPAEALRFVFLSLVVPIGFLPAMQREGAPIWAILGVLALELAAGGVDNSLAQIGRSRGPWPDLLRATLQGAGAVAMWAALGAGGPAAAVQGAGAFAVLVTLADVLGRFWRHRDHFLALSSLA